MAVAAVVVAATGCSTSGSNSSPQAVPSLNDEQLTDWLGYASEIVGPCHESVSQADGAFEQFVTANRDPQLAMPVLMAAGQAVEQCVIDPTEQAGLEVLAETFPQGAELLGQWMAAAEVTASELLVVAAGNTDSRLLVGELVEQMRINDNIGSQITELAVAAGDAAGFDASEYRLHRWDPPDH